MRANAVPNGGALLADVIAAVFAFEYLAFAVFKELNISSALSHKNNLPENPRFYAFFSD